MTESVLEVEGLSVTYGGEGDGVQAVRGVDFVLHEGELLGLAGESGSGKSSLAQGLLRLLRPPGTVTGGYVRYFPRGEPGSGRSPVDLLGLDPTALRALRWSELSIVFQGSMNSLNPVLSVEAQVGDVLRTHRPELSRHQRRERCRELLDLVRVDARRMASFPHQLSGGMRQRVMLAMALALDPRVIVFDEPTTALDPVVQREILDEIARLRALRRFAAIFITHDLSLLLEIADTIAVMYAGRIVEIAPAAALAAEPAHPYSAALLRSFPPISGPQVDLVEIPGAPPDLYELPVGCTFAPRCPRASSRCRAEAPELRAVGTVSPCERLAACWHPGVAVPAEAPVRVG